MSELESINKIFDKPNTTKSLIEDFKRIGVIPGMTLLVHSSLSAIGWVCGGPVAVIKALEEVLTAEGTLVMPTHSGDISDPSHWSNPAVPETWWQIIRDEMPLFDKYLTPTRGMGKIPETFRKQESVIRSSHPSASFAAWGKNKEYILQDDHYDFSQNEFSPLGRIYELGGNILLIGVDYDNCTSLHLAEYKANYDGKKIVTDGFPVLEDGIRKWHIFKDILYFSDDFINIGTQFEDIYGIKNGKIGNAESKLIDQRIFVDFSSSWMEKNRKIT